VHRLELVSGPVPALAVDGRPIPVGPVPAVALTATGRRTATATALLVTRASAREALLLHRIGDLAARTPRHRFPFAEGDDGRLRFAGGWTSGFWPGALWSAADLDAGGPYGAWALDASLARMRNADSPTHDLGFMFGRSGLQAERRLCGGALLDASVLCLGLRAGPLAAADTLVRLAATNPAGTIPTDARSAEAETIIDSLMNLDLLVWAGRATGDERYPALARAHAHRVLAELLRPDGSTIQAVHFDRATGAVTGRHTHQGISADSTWSRGQAWAIYGFAQTGRGLGDPVLVAAAERAARWWAEHAPVGTPPPYDFSAPPGALRDSSAAMIAAAGLQRLAAACVALPGSCREPERWAPLATRVLDEGLVAVSAVPPLGRLGEQAYRVGPRGGAWDDRAEFIWGLDYALEAVAGRARR
jgi:unsaturated chondroitin disaccharide hydrolase